MACIVTGIRRFDGNIDRDPNEERITSLLSDNQVNRRESSGASDVCESWDYARGKRFESKAAPGLQYSVSEEHS
jgi:hypothetical protein